MGFTDSILPIRVQSAYAGRSLWFIFTVCFLETVAGGSTSTLLSTYLPSITRDLPGITPEKGSGFSAMINAVFFAGWTIGGLTWGLLSDKIGRRRSLSLAVGMVGLFTVLIGLIPFWETLIVFRFLSGFGVGGILVVATTFLSEIWPEESRAVYIGLLSIGFPVGIFSTGAIVYLIEDWKLGFLTGILPLFLSMITWFTFRESERWKQTVLTAGNRRIVLKIREHRPDIIKGAVIFGAMVIGLWALFLWIPTWVQTIVADGTGREKGGLSMMLLGIGGLSGGTLSGWVFRILGARKAMTICFSGCFVLSFILFGLNDHFTRLTMVEITLLSFMFGISQGMLSVYIPLLFPPAIRGTATGICFNTGRVLTTAAVFFVGALVGFFGGYDHSLLAFSCVFLIGLVFILLTPEKQPDMPYIKVPEGVPGIRSLVMFRPETGKSLYALAQALLRGESPLSEAERELIAAYVSSLNRCRFCTESHAAASRYLFRDEKALVDGVLEDYTSAPVSKKLKALLHIAGKVQVNGNMVTTTDVENARAVGAVDRDIHDTVLIAATFSMFNRYVDGLASYTPTDPAEYEAMGKRMGDVGYVMPAKP